MDLMTEKSDDKDLDIVIEGDLAPVADAKPVERPIIAPEEGLDTLKANLERERQGRLDAERRANEALRQADQAGARVQDSNLTLIASAIETVKQNTVLLKANYANALRAGDFEAAADLQNEMSTNAAKLLQLEGGKTALEQEAKQPRRPAAQNDPVEAFASTLAPPSRDWIRAHPEYVNNPRLNQKMVAAHNLVEADGVVADTPEYFQRIEEVLGLRRPAPTEQNDDPTRDAAQVMQRRSAPAAAPTTARASSNGSRPTTVRLSAQEREIAEMMGMSEQDYAKNKLALQQEGVLK
jgi:hypothetical protein